MTCNWCLCDAELKSAQMAFSGGAYTSAGKFSQLVDWYQWHQNVHRSRHLSFSLAPAQPCARLAAQPPASILISESQYRKPWSNCILCDISIPDKTVKLWKISERDKRPEGYNLKDEDGRIRNPSTITSLRVSDLSGLTPPKMSHGVGKRLCVLILLPC